ncbi:hypothetical protein ACP4OV_016506 [Aristida adscensionis]
MFRDTLSAPLRYCRGLNPFAVGSIRPTSLAVVPYCNHDHRMSPPTVAAAAVPSGLLLRSPVTQRPLPTARLLSPGAAGPLQVSSTRRRRIPATAVRAQSSTNPGREPLSPLEDYILAPLLGSSVPKSIWAGWILADSAAFVGVRVLAGIGVLQDRAVEGASCVLGECWGSSAAREPHSQSDLEYSAGSPQKTSILQGLLEMGIRGVTVSDVRGFGAQGGSTERHGGSEFSEDTFITKVKMEIVVCKEQVEAVIDKIIEKARTGEIGDGKIFLIPVADMVRIRTGERGKQAERMTGGLSDKLSSVVSIS